MTTTASPAGIRSAPAAAPSGILLTILLGGLFMNLLDVSIVNVAIGPLQRDLHAGGAQLQLIVSAYVMAYAALLITGARLGGRFGHRRMFRAGLLGFSLTSLACGLATSADALIALRVSQGVAAASMLPQVMSLIQVCFPAGPARARALGWYGLVLALGTVAGQLAGGVLLQADIAGSGWRSVFLINVPIGVLLWWLAGSQLPTRTSVPVDGLDLPGVVCFGAVISLVVVPLVLGRSQGWPAWGWVAWGCAAFGTILMVLIERRSVAPVLPADVLRTSGLLPGIALCMLTVGGYAGYLFTLSLHLQTALRMGPLATGIAFLPLAAGFAAASLSSPRLPRRLTRWLIPVGLLGCVATYPVLGAVVGDGARPSTGFYLLLVVLGAGQGYAVTPVIGLSLAAVPVRRAAEASGLLSSAFQLAQVAGVTGVGSLYLDRAGSAGSAGAVRTVCEVLAFAAAAALVCSVRLLRVSPG
ncbi:MFS transporter [Allobranchiibius huperziae]|uniref:Putative MFS family arabinose efflux permease n=1 Tax=Allobranchiibius huperziae TaxID=1874116 RepID=A0A853DHV7_9MICO|nr:MFS transporter [Allobranchiibius huperziae]NYJ74624.1 putative MFS family arabinose efflux permease [Allobranchiibius huperziae]